MYWGHSAPFCVLFTKKTINYSEQKGLFAMNSRDNHSTGMNRLLVLLTVLLYSVGALAQSTSPDQKLSVADRMAKARAAKAQKREAETRAATYGSKRTETASRPGYKTPAATGVPTEKKLKGPNGEEVLTGERGAKYYINKNGHRTYLSSNQ